LGQHVVKTLRPFRRLRGPGRRLHGPCRLLRGGGSRTAHEKPREAPCLPCMMVVCGSRWEHLPSICKPVVQAMHPRRWFRSAPRLRKGPPEQRCEGERLEEDYSPTEQPHAELAHGRRPPCGAPTDCSGGVASEDIRLGGTLPEPPAPPVPWLARSRGSVSPTSAQVYSTAPYRRCGIRRCHRCGLRLVGSRG